ncbi:hypothetical protein OU995_21490 [Roseateles sp. SL47]|uniref:energy transducer TonB n=1 Tax=Roseateles sp. SL47 TaxID=2995138 RepID=UPI00226EA083|nr:hypothetical protein [Roseateles sp. SL47]WAC72116.1 hypothetical protein OU995_21490 [Roseateles sp. SL47]
MNQPKSACAGAFSLWSHGVVQGAANGPVGRPVLVPMSRSSGVARVGLRWAASLGLTVVMAGCGGPSPRVPAAPSTVSAQPARPAAPAQGPVQGPEAPTALVNSQGRLEPPHAVSTHEELRHQAALRLVAANPDATYMGEVPAVLLAIPVLEVELNRDGSVRNIRVLRRPGQAVDTIELAMAAVRRAAPYGDVSHLPHPWKFNEVFLFNNDRRFKPRTLD